MPLVFQDWYVRQNAIDNRDTLYVFGDNMARQGYGGQAREMRGEWNAVGIPTKHLPALSSKSYFHDSDFPNVVKQIDFAFRKLRRHLKTNGKVIWPANGVGTDRADLANKAPKIAKYIADRLAKLIELSDNMENEK